jgi:hypothetical protein
MKMNEEFSSTNWNEWVKPRWPKGETKNTPELQRALLLRLSLMGWGYNPMEGSVRDPEEHHEGIFLAGMALALAEDAEDLVKRLKQIRIGDSVVRDDQRREKSAKK